MEVFVLVGSLGAVALGWFLAQLGERWRWQREDRNRFAATKRELYAQFLIEATAIFDDYRLATYAAQRTPTVPKGNVPKETADVFIMANRKLRQSEVELKLLAGSPEVLHAAAELRDIAGFGIGVVAEQHDPHAPDGPWALLEARWVAASVAFEKAARADLRV